MTPRDLIRQQAAAVARLHGVDPAAMYRPGRLTRRVARARNAAMWLIWWSHGWSFGQVGRLFNRDNTTAWMAIGAHMARCGIDHPLAACRRAKLARDTARINARNAGRHERIAA